MLKKAYKKASKKAVKKAAPKKKAAKPQPWPRTTVAKKTAQKTPKKAAPKKAIAKKVAKKSAVKRSASTGGFNASLTPSPALAAVIGSTPAPRTTIVKKIWDYIKKNSLQDKSNKRMINADSKLKTLFGGKNQISMFDLAKIVSQNVK